MPPHAARHAFHLGLGRSVDLDAGDAARELGRSWRFSGKGFA
jgi:hypothetical protein